MVRPNIFTQITVGGAENGSRADYIELLCAGYGKDDDSAPHRLKATRPPLGRNRSNYALLRHPLSAYHVLRSRINCAGGSTPDFIPRETRNAANSTLLLGGSPRAQIPPLDERICGCLTSGRIGTPVAAVRRLRESERRKALELLHSDRFADRSPGQIVAVLLDEGQYVCSESTMYRLLREHGEVRERRRQVRHPEYTASPSFSRPLRISAGLGISPNCAVPTAANGTRC